jgi:arylsulfatase A-like enzyme
MPQPNILLIHADQHRYDCLGANGHPFIQTPHLDALAARGARFTHAFTPSPVCVPERNSLLFGCWPARHLVIANRGTEAPRGPVGGLPSFSGLLRDAGYRLGMVGKWDVDAHLGPLDCGFDDYVPGHDYGVWRAAQGLPSRPQHNAWFGEVDPHIAPEQSALGWGAERTIELLRRYAAGDAPFLVRWDPEEPHLPNIVPEPFFSLYPPASIPPWPSFGDTLAGKPYIQAQQLRTWGLDGWAWEQWAPTVSAYMGQISLLDAQVGRVLAALDALGLAANTLVVYTCDHGDTCGGHGMIDKHFIMYDDVLHVPLMLRWPERLAAGTVRDDLVIHAIDLAATFVEAAGAERPATFAGASLLSETGRQDVYGTYAGSQFGLYSQRAVRDRRYKYVWNATAEDELYDLERDPGELTNLAGDLAQAETLARLRRRLLAWLEETADPLCNGWIVEQLRRGRKI